MKRLASFVLGLVLLALSSCAPPACVGNNCSCPSLSSCVFDGCTAGTAGCDFFCEKDATCSGACGTGCNVTCTGDSCTHTVGGGSNVACGAGTCNITCEGTCVASAVGGKLNVTCRSSSKTSGGCE